MRRRRAPNDLPRRYSWARDELVRLRLESVEQGRKLAIAEEALGDIALDKHAFSLSYRTKAQNALEAMNGVHRD